MNGSPLGAGEISSLLYAQCHGCILLITDKKGTREAKRRGVQCITTEDVILHAIARGYISAVEADQLLAGWASMAEFPTTRTSFRGLGQP